MMDKTTGVKAETEYYRIDNTRGKGKELLSLLESKVKIRGDVRRGKDGITVLTVRDYEILTLYEPEPGEKINPMPEHPDVNQEEYIPDEEPEPDEEAESFEEE